jgi:diguanylate cyclase (GGDEF)-like protein/PAS domain S-box-containing protein
MATIVIVDDQPLNLRIVSRFARAIEEGIVVRTFDSPVEALSEVSANPPDLIVTDFMMPDMDGETFIRQCRALESLRDVPIIVLTAYEDRELRYRALEAGASDFLLSPVDAQEFCKRGRNLLALWRHQQTLNTRAISLQWELNEAHRLHAEDIRYREALLRAVINTVPALIRASDANGNVLFLNKSHDHYLDLVNCDTAAASGGVDSTILNSVDSTYGDRHEELDKEVIQTGQIVSDIEETLTTREGDDRVLLTTKAPLSEKDGATTHVVTVSLDITQRKKQEQAVRESEERFRNLVEGSVLGIVIESTDGIVFANAALASIFDYSRSEELLKIGSLRQLFAATEWPRLDVIFDGASDAHLAERQELRGLRRDGDPIWVEAQFQRVSWNGSPALQATIADITLRKAYEECLQRQANFDELTGLPNRVLASDRLQTAVAGALRHGHRGGVLFIDLDQFKKINDTWGHSVGDDLLKSASKRLISCVRREDTVARLGGDEFIIILPNLADASHAEPVIQKILAAFSQPFPLGNHEAFVTASVGVALFPDDSDDPMCLMRHADTAMYRAKEQGRNTFEFFTPELNARAIRRVRIESQLFHALDRNEVTLHYQPIVDLQRNQVVSAEALMRWTSKENGSVSPDEFIPLAEDTGLIVPLGRWALATACQQLSRWHASGLHDMCLSVNISTRQLRVGNFVSDTLAALEAHGLSPSSIELEVTEGSLMTDIGEFVDVLRTLHTLGFSIALDDFGTGYSRLSHLKELPVNTLKIDKSFVQSVTTKPGEAAVVEAIIAMAQRLGLRVIGEGVEHLDQVRFLGNQGCTLAQGYFFSKPLSAEGFDSWRPSGDSTATISPMQPVVAQTSVSRPRKRQSLNS